MDGIIIKCKKILGGLAKGEAMVSSVPISIMSEIDEINGVLRAKEHELKGMSIENKIGSSYEFVGRKII
jgi:predicted aconitase with swiveling domain